MPTPEPVTIGRVIGDAIAVPCVAALVIPIIAMVFARWKPSYGTVAIWVLVVVDVGWGIALFLYGLSKLRKQSATGAGNETDRP